MVIHIVFLSNTLSKYPVVLSNDQVCYYRIFKRIQIQLQMCHFKADSIITISSQFKEQFSWKTMVVVILVIFTFPKSDEKSENQMEKYPSCALLIGLLYRWCGCDADMEFVKYFALACVPKIYKKEPMLIAFGIYSIFIHRIEIFP